MDRREFLKISAAGALGLVLPAPDILARKSAEDKYSVVILGDTHYDDADPLKYHAGYFLENKKREANHRQEFVRNGNMWSGRCKDLVKRAACLVDDDTRFVLQMGDLIQGDTASAEIHERFLSDAMDYFKESLSPDLPFVTVVGNHDVRANDDETAAAAYRRYMTARMSQELKQEISDTSFAFTAGPDSYVVIDFTKPDGGIIEKLLKGAEGARHVFVVCHSPVFPFDSGKYFWWYLMGGRTDPMKEERRYVRKLLARSRAIVLCGHVHRTELLDWYGDGGRITQITMSSVWASESEGSYKELASGKSEFGVLKYRDTSRRTEITDAVMQEYAAGIRRYSVADAAGSYKLFVGDRDVHVDFYAGSSSRLSHRFRLR